VKHLVRGVVQPVPQSLEAILWYDAVAKDFWWQPTTLQFLPHVVAYFLLKDAHKLHLLRLFPFLVSDLRELSVDFIEFLYRLHDEIRGNKSDDCADGCQDFHGNVPLAALTIAIEAEYGFAEIRRR
jgi:hypothetical protein